jgi:NTE family protein
MTDRFFNLVKVLSSATVLLVLIGCASYGVIDNQQQKFNKPDPDNYALYTQPKVGTDNAVWLAFSGGGTRASALSYGVLEELRDTKINGDDSRSVLAGVDVISSVSGGSFTAAYYGLYGDQIFEDYESDFLRKNIEKSLIRRMFLNPLQWFRRTGRTEQAIRFYDKNIFHGATFADLKAKKGPTLLINATDLGYGVRFTFIQEYFDLLNSDISSFSVARAVTASSAVPVLFDPVVAMNYPPPTEQKKKPKWLEKLQGLTQKGGNPQLQMLTGGVSSYFDKNEHKFVHYVDGGITDNLGLRAIHDIIEMGGGIKATYEHTGLTRPPRRLIMISVNASAKKDPTMGATNKQPKLSETMGSVTAIQMRRYTDSTLNMMQESMDSWAAELSTPEHPVTAHFIQIRFADIEDEKERDFLNAMPTSFSLTDEQVDALIKAGRELLRNNPEFKKLLAETN